MENVQKIQAIELLMATHAVHRRRTMDHDGTSAGWGEDFVVPPRLRGLYATVGAMSPPMEGDRYLKVHHTPYAHTPVRAFSPTLSHSHSPLDHSPPPVTCTNSSNF